ncbi:MAG: SDR family oxidoreductase [Polyangiaceae bacterium]|nr:SDR family oxidoreductase [Polyangiaceae bacterium]
MKKDYALITGASSGIGLAMAHELADQGYPLILVARRIDRLESLAADIRKRTNVDVCVIPLDLSEPDAAERLREETARRKLHTEILINNAGYGMQGKFIEMDTRKMAAMFRLNIDALTFLCREFAPAMVERKHGYILNVASASAFLPSPYVAAYAASQAFVGQFSEALRFELEGTGVSVTTLYPGVTTTEFNDVAGAKHPPLMNASVLTAAQVARISLRAMFRRKRSIVPGIINKINAFFSQVFHRGIITYVAGTLLKKANGH